MVSCQKDPTRHAYAWQIGPFWQDTLDIWYSQKKAKRQSSVLLLIAKEVLLLE